MTSRPGWAKVRACQAMWGRGRVRQPERRREQKHRVELDRRPSRRRPAGESGPVPPAPSEAMSHRSSRPLPRRPPTSAWSPLPRLVSGSTVGPIGTTVVTATAVDLPAAAQAHVRPFLPPVAADASMPLAASECPSGRPAPPAGPRPDHGRRETLRGGMSCPTSPVAIPYSLHAPQQHDATCRQPPRPWCGELVVVGAEHHRPLHRPPGLGLCARWSPGPAARGPEVTSGPSRLTLRRGPPWGERRRPSGRRPPRRAPRAETPVDVGSAPTAPSRPDQRRLRQRHGHAACGSVRAIAIRTPSSTKTSAAFLA